MSRLVIIPKLINILLDDMTHVFNKKTKFNYVEKFRNPLNTNSIRFLKNNGI